MFVTLNCNLSFSHLRWDATHYPGHKYDTASVTRQPPEQHPVLGRLNRRLACGDGMDAMGYLLNTSLYTVFFYQIFAPTIKDIMVDVNISA